MFMLGLSVSSLVRNYVDIYYHSRMLLDISFSHVYSSRNLHVVSFDVVSCTGSMVTRLGCKIIKVHWGEKASGYVRLPE